MKSDKNIDINLVARLGYKKLEHIVTDQLIFRPLAARQRINKGAFRLLLTICDNFFIAVM